MTDDPFLWFLCVAGSLGLGWAVLMGVWLT